MSKPKTSTVVHSCPNCLRPDVKPHSIYGQRSWFCEHCRHYGPWHDVSTKKTPIVLQVELKQKKEKKQSVASKLLASLTGT